MDEQPADHAVAALVPNDASKQGAASCRVQQLEGCFP